MTKCIAQKEIKLLGTSIPPSKQGLAVLNFQHFDLNFLKLVEFLKEIKLFEEWFILLNVACKLNYLLKNVGLVKRD